MESDFLSNYGVIQLMN